MKALLTGLSELIFFKSLELFDINSTLKQIMLGTLWDYETSTVKGLLPILFLSFCHPQKGF